MSQMHNGDRTTVKNDGSYHPEPENLKHHRSQPSAAVIPGRDEDDPGSGNWEGINTAELRQRARALALPNWQAAGREELVDALQKYRESEVEPRKTEH